MPYLKDNYLTFLKLVLYFKTLNTLWRYIMLRWSLIFLVFALVAGVFGFTGVAGTAMGIAKILFVLFLVLCLITFVMGRKAVSKL